LTAIAGRNGLVYLQGTGAEATLIAEANHWRLAFEPTIEDAPRFGDVFIHKVRGMMKGSGAIDGQFDTAVGGITLWDSIQQLTSRKFYMYADVSAPTSYYYGLCWPKLSIDVPMGVAKFAMALDIDGNLSRN
jgi:hypothetical protein